MDNFHRITTTDVLELNSNKERFINWRSHLYHNDDNTYFLLAKFFLLNKIDADKAHEYFNRFFFIDIYNLDIHGHQSIKSLFALLSNKVYIQDKSIVRNNLRTEILGRNVSYDYSCNTRHQDCWIRYCPECLKVLKVPDYASFDYLNRCLVHDVQFSKFYYNKSRASLKHRSIKCFQYLILEKLPNFPTVITAAQRDFYKASSDFIHFREFHESLESRLDQYYGNHIYTLKKSNNFISANSLLSLINSYPKKNDSIARFFAEGSGNILIKMHRLKRIYLNPILTRISSLSFFILVRSYSSFSYLYRQGSALFIIDILNFIDELRVSMEKRESNFWSLNSKTSTWYYSEFDIPWGGTRIEQCLIDWLVEYWIPPLYDDNYKQKLNYFLDFAFENLRLVDLKLFDPVEEILNFPDKIVSFHYFNHLTFRELSRPLFSLEEMNALDEVLLKVVHSTIRDVRVYLSEINSGKKPDRFPPKSLSQLTLQEINGEIYIFDCENLNP